MHTQESLEDSVIICETVEVGQKRLSSPLSRSGSAMNDEDYARKLAQEEEDAALAKAIGLSEEVNLENEVIIEDSEDDDQTTSTSTFPFGAFIASAIQDTNSGFSVPSSSATDSAASVPAMRSNLFKHKDADTGFTATSHIVDRIRCTLRTDFMVARFYLAADCVHLASQAENLGNWSCGYRNAQLLFSSFLAFPALVEHMQKMLDGMFVPTIRLIQTLIKVQVLIYVS